MTKDEAEKAIHHLRHVWRKESGQQQVPPGQLSFYSFRQCVQDGYPGYLTFRSRMSADDVVESWFDSEFGQPWRD